MLPEGKIKVLLADDQTMIRQGFGYVIGLQSDMMLVGEASDGREAVDLAAACQPDVILMDVQMPELDGISATRWIRAMSGDVRNIPIIALTAHAMKGFQEEIMAVGFSGYLTKPIDIDVLLQTLAGFLHAQQRKKISDNSCSR